MDIDLTTRRLRLRAPRLTDADRLALLLDNIAVSGNLARVPYPYRAVDARAWLRSWRPDRPPEDTGLTIDLPGEGLIGHLGFHSDGGATQVGYWLGEPYWNQGYMSEALEAALQWFFEVSEIDVLKSGVFHFNAASLAIQRKFGFVTIGERMLHCLARGEQVRHIDTELTRAAWSERRAA